MSLILNETMDAEAARDQDRKERLDEQSFEALLVIKEEVEKCLQNKKAARIAELRALVAGTAAYVGVSPEELVSCASLKDSPAPIEADKAPPAPKYRDPETGATWTGRGKAPAWMKAWIESGGDKEALRIGAAKQVAAEVEF